MKPKIIVALISAAATVAAAVISFNLGKTTEHKVIQNEINNAFGEVVNVVGDGNDVSINDISNFVNDYLKIKEQNTNLTEQNAKYFDDLKNTNSKVEELSKLMNDIPDIQYKNIGLSIEGDTIPINTTNSSIVIDNRSYYSDEFIYKLIGENTNASIQNGTMYIGKIIKEKANLLDKPQINKTYEVRMVDGIEDTYGNVYGNVLKFNYTSHDITFNVNRDYANFKCIIAMQKNCNGKGVIQIKADDEIVYTSQEITSLVNPNENKIDIPINHASKLTISCIGDSSKCNIFIADTILYN